MLDARITPPPPQKKKYSQLFTDFIFFAEKSTEPPHHLKNVHEGLLAIYTYLQKYSVCCYIINGRNTTKSVQFCL